MLIRIILPRNALAAALVALSAISASAQQPGPAAIPAGFVEDVLPALRPILAGAVSRAPDTVSAAIDVARSEYDVLSRKSALLPHFNLNANYSWSTGAALGEIDPATGLFRSESGNPFANTGPWTTSNGFSYSIGVSQSIFEWGSIVAGIRSAKLSEENARMRFAENYRRLALNLRSEYLTLVYKKATVRAARSTREDAARALRTRQSEVAAGTLGAAEVNLPTVADMEAQVALERAEQVYEFSRRTFARVAGLEDLPDSAIPDDIPAIQPAPAAGQPAYAGGPASTLQGRIYSNVIKQADLGIKQAKTAQLPKFNAGANYGLGFNTSVTGNLASRSASISGSASIGFGWNIWDGFASRANLRHSLATKRANELQLRNYIDSTNETLEGLRAGAALAGRELAVADFRRELAAGGLRTLQERLGTAGGPSQANIDASAQTFRAAELVALGARVNYLNRISEYRSLSGEDPVLQYLPAEYRTVVNPNGR